MFEGRNLEFGIPKRKVEKAENLYAGKSLLIIHAAPAAKKQTFKFELTEEVIKALGLEKKDGEDVKTVSFAFVSKDEVYVVNSTTADFIDAKHKYQLSMNGIFSSKDAHKYLTELLNLSTDTNHEFILNVVENSIPTAQLLIVPMVNETIETEDLPFGENN